MLLHGLVVLAEADVHVVVLVLRSGSMRIGIRLVAVVELLVVALVLELLRPQSRPQKLVRTDVQRSGIFHFDTELHAMLDCCSEWIVPDFAHVKHALLDDKIAAFLRAHLLILGSRLPKIAQGRP